MEVICSVILFTEQLHLVGERVDDYRANYGDGDVGRGSISRPFLCVRLGVWVVFHFPSLLKIR